MIILYSISILLVIFIVVCLVSLVRDYHRFVVRHYRVRSPKVGRRVTLVFISDLHNKVYGEDNEAIYAAIREAEPDDILIGGDMTIAKPAIHKAFAGDVSGMDEALRFLKRLPAIAPTYFVNGNHEQRILETGENNGSCGCGENENSRCYLAVREMMSRFYEELGRCGIHQLHNASIALGRDTNVILYGYEHACEHYEKLFSNPIPNDDVARKVGEPDAAAFNLLLAHNPKFYKTYARWGADLVLSGHVHGGLLRIGRLGFIGPDLHLFPRYSGGTYYDGNSEMILSCGLGAHTLPIRIFNPGEISVVELLPQNE